MNEVDGMKINETCMPLIEEDNELVDFDKEADDLLGPTLMELEAGLPSTSHPRKRKYMDTTSASNVVSSNNPTR